MSETRLEFNDEQGRRAIRIDNELFTIGRRAENDLRLAGKEVSREHATNSRSVLPKQSPVQIIEFALTAYVFAVNKRAHNGNLFPEGQTRHRGEDLGSSIRQPVQWST